MVQINITKNLRTWLGFTVMELMAEKTGDDVNKLMQEFNLEDPVDADQVVEIECKINGVEVNFKHLVTIMEKSYYDEVKSAAKEMLQERFSEIQDKAYQINEDLNYVQKLVESMEDE